MAEFLGPLQYFSRQSSEPKSLRHCENSDFREFGSGTADVRLSTANLNPTAIRTTISA